MSEELALLDGVYIQRFEDKTFRAYMLFTDGSRISIPEYLRYEIAHNCSDFESDSPWKLRLSALSSDSSLLALHFHGTTKAGCENALKFMKRQAAYLAGEACNAAT